MLNRNRKVFNAIIFLLMALSSSNLFIIWFLWPRQNFLAWFISILSTFADIGTILILELIRRIYTKKNDTRGKFKYKRPL